MSVLGGIDVDGYTFSENLIAVVFHTLFNLSGEVAQQSGNFCLVDFFFHVALKVFDDPLAVPVFLPRDAGPELPPNNALHRNSRCPRTFIVIFHSFPLVALHHRCHRLWVSLVVRQLEHTLIL